MPENKKHNASDCPMRTHMCPICVSLKKDVAVSSSHWAVMCNQSNFENLKKAYESNTENWYQDKLLTVRENVQDLFQDDEMYGNESRPAIQHENGTSELDAY